MIEALQFDKKENYKRFSKYQFFRDYIKIGMTIMTMCTREIQNSAS